MVEENRQDLPLDEVMLAMDVVDTLRHRELLVSRELNSEHRDQSLITRLRELYASQGIEVPDRILTAGVEALKEDRFSYTPPVKSLQRSLALVYVERGKWLRRLGILALVVGLIMGAYHLLVVRPANQQLDLQITTVAGGIAHSASRLNSMDELQAELARQLSSFDNESAGGDGTSFRLRHQAASDAISDASLNIDRARGLDFSTSLNRDNFEQLSPRIEQGLEQHKRYLDQAAMELQEAQAAIEGMDLLTDLPQKLQAEQGAIEQITGNEEALKQARQLYSSALAALQVGDIEVAEAAYRALGALRTTLSLSYRLRIVSHPDEFSGVWRIPDDNPDAKNYYLIVEAIAEDGSALTLPVNSEEDGAQHRVNRWGIRVDEKLFQSVAKDKQDDGIIQKREVGRKQRGDLKVKYSIDTPGATITSW